VEPEIEPVQIATQQIELNMKKLIVLALFALTLVTVGQAMAQDDNTNTPPSGPGYTNSWGTNGFTWWTNTPPVVLTNLPPDNFTNFPPYTNFPPIWTNSAPTWTNSNPAWTNSWPAWTNQPTTWTNTLPVWTNTPPVYTNQMPVWTNTAPVWTNLPTAWTNVPTSCTNTTHFRPTNGLPGSVRGVAQQFNSQRNQLIQQLQSATDQAQREAVLGQLENLREQLQQQLQSMTVNARDQISQTYGQYANPMRSGLNQGSGSGTANNVNSGGSGGGSSSTHGGAPRP
jgi:hypothetical protein